MSRFRNVLFEVVCVVLSLAILVFSANLLVNGAREWANHTQNQILKNLLSIESSSQADFTVQNKHTVDLVLKFAGAYMDYIVETEEIQPISLSAFSSFYSILPGDVTVESFSFEKDVLYAQCTADEKIYDELAANIKKYNDENKIFITKISQEENLIRFTVQVTY